MEATRRADAAVVAPTRYYDMSSMFVQPTFSTDNGWFVRPGSLIWSTKCVEQGASRYRPSKIAKAHGHFEPCHANADAMAADYLPHDR